MAITPRTKKLLESYVRKQVRKIITESEDEKWVRRGDSYWRGDYLRVEFNKVGSYLYAKIYLPKISNEYSSDGLLYRYSSPLIGVKKTLEYIGNIDNKYQFKDLKVLDADDKTSHNILRDISNYRNVIGYNP